MPIQLPSETGWIDNLYIKNTKLLTAQCAGEEWLQWRFKKGYLGGDVISETETRCNPAFYGTYASSNYSATDSAFVSKWLQEHAGASSSVYPLDIVAGHTDDSAWRQSREITNVRQEEDGLHYDIICISESWFIYVASEWADDDFAVDMMSILLLWLLLALLLSSPASHSNLEDIWEKKIRFYKNS